MRSEWNLGYPRFIIDDGGPDITVGETLSWHALEFWSKHTLTPSDSPVKAAMDDDDFGYTVNAEVVFLSETASVIDFGLRAVGSPDLPRSGALPGSFVSGLIYLGLPLCTPVVPYDLRPAFAYKFQVKSIWADVTPYVQAGDASGGVWLVRDAGSIRYQSVLSTAALHANSYVLRCLVIPQPPGIHSSLQGPL